MNVCIFVFKMEMNRMKKELDIITFDADDTLWENELFSGRTNIVFAN